MRERHHHHRGSSSDSLISKKPTEYQPCDTDAAAGSTACAPQNQSAKNRIVCQDTTIFDPYSNSQVVPPVAEALAPPLE